MKAIVNLSTGRYLNGQKRLAESLKGKTDADFISFTDESQVGAPKHKDNPYAFKIYAIKKASELGYDQILWLDSSAYAVGDVEKIFNLIKRNGYFFEDSGHYASTWTNDRTLEYFGLTRDEAENVRLYSAGFTGLNLKNSRAQEFLKEWEKAMLAGMFIGEWNNINKTESQDIRCEGHRHDLCCASIIAWKLGMKFQDNEKYFQYASPEEPLSSPSIIFKAQGI